MMNPSPIQSGNPNSGRQLHLHIEPHPLTFVFSHVELTFDVISPGKTTKQRIRKCLLPHYIIKKENPQTLLPNGVNCCVLGLNATEMYQRYTPIPCEVKR